MLTEGGAAPREKIRVADRLPRKNSLIYPLPGRSLKNVTPKVSVAPL